MTDRRAGESGSRARGGRRAIRTPRNELVVNLPGRFGAARAGEREATGGSEIAQAVGRGPRGHGEDRREPDLDPPIGVEEPVDAEE